MMDITPEMARQELERRKAVREYQSSITPEMARQEQARRAYEGQYEAPPRKKGWAGVAEDISEIPGAVMDYLVNVPHEMGESWGQVKSNPVRAAKNLGYGLGSSLYEGINAVNNLSDYLKSKEIPAFQGYEPQMFPMIFGPGLSPLRDISFKNLLGLEEEEPGDKFLRELGGLAPGIPAVPWKGIVSGVKKMPELFTRGKLRKEIGTLSEQERLAQTAHEASIEDYQALQSKLMSMPGESPYTLESMRKKIAEKGENISQLESQKSDYFNRFNINRDLQASIDAEKEIANTMDQYLLKGYEHGVPVSEGVVKEIEGTINPKTGKREGGIKQTIGRLYKNIENRLKSEKVVLPRTAELAKLEKDSRKLLEQSRDFFKSDKEFEAAVQNLVESGKKSPKYAGDNTVPANEILSQYRTMRHLSNKLRKEAYSTKVASNKDLQKNILSRADEMENSAKALETYMENSNLGGVLDDLKLANSRWRNEVTPLYSNSLYQTFLNKGYAPKSSLIEALRGSGPGQEIIRNIIKKDPELLRNIIGQTYSKSPEKLHEFSELAHEYIKEVPALQEVLDLQRKQKAKSEKIRKEMGTPPTAKERFKIDADINKLHSERDVIKASLKELSEKSNKKDITLKEKIRIEELKRQKTEKLKKIDERINKIKRFSKKAAYVGGGLGVLKARPWDYTQRNR